MEETSSNSLRDTLSQTYQEFAQQVLDLAPHLLGALALLLVGWAIAHIVRVLVRNLLGGVDSILNRFVKIDGAKQAHMRRSYAAVLSQVMFWTVMLFFIAAAANLFGWRLFAVWMENLVAYLPSLVTGLLIIFAGLLLGSGVRALATKAGTTAGLDHCEVIGRSAQIVVILAMTIIGVEQAGINVSFLTNLLVVGVGVFLAGGALAFGLGAKSLVANVIGAQYLRKHLKLGETMQVGETEGTVVEISQTAIVLDTGTGKAFVPARLFHEAVSQVNTSGEKEQEEPK